MKGKYILEVEGVKQTYLDHSENSFQVLNDINLQIRKGEFVTIVGPTGCGKSTLLRMILGSEHPSSGRILMEGKEVRKPNRNIGVVFQKYSLFDNLTVSQNVRIGLELENFGIMGNFLNMVLPSWKLESFKDLVYEYLEKVNLVEHADKLPYQLSGGMRQRVAIAQAMIMKPQILLMDEPFGALDAGTREQMHAFMLDQWRETGQTILFVTHDLEEAIYLGTRVIVLSQYYKEANGAKVVKDFNTPWPQPRETSIKEEIQFQDIIKSIRNQGLNSNYLMDYKDFDLSHKDAYIHQQN